MSVTERFIRYAKIDTQSDPTSSSIPSTEKQKNLGRLLVQELREMGIPDAHIDEFGYVYGTIPATTDRMVPVICFCSHMDTSPDSSGTDVKPIIHENYQGQDLVLPDDPSQIIRLEDHPKLGRQIGNDIITASGTTLLGADNKAGVAEIMTAADYLMKHPEIPHGTIKILFTPDEEIGCGVDKVDMEKLGADFGYTVDGEEVGTYQNETFSADGATIKVHGISAHPGFAKGKLVSAIKVAAAIVDALPKDRLSPETTEGMEGFVHPTSIKGNAELTEINFILRDFQTEKLREHAALLQQTIDKIIPQYPGARAELIIKEQYRNMKEVLDKHPQVADIAREAIERAGLTPKPESIRGGTDGSRLSFMGLPCPNIFAGEYAFHSKHEWTSVQDMKFAVQTILHICNIWYERAE